MKLCCERETITRRRRLFDCWVIMFLLALWAGPGSAIAQGNSGALLNTFTNPTPAEFDSFGWSVAAIGNDRVLIGAPFDSTAAPGAGAAYLYSFNGDLLHIFLNPTPRREEGFGTGWG